MGFIIEAPDDLNDKPRIRSDEDLKNERLNGDILIDDIDWDSLQDVWIEENEM